MRREVIGNSELYLGDCMDLMKQFPDNYFNLAIVDPPYGINAVSDAFKRGNKQYGNAATFSKLYEYKEWDSKPVDKDYIIELFRISQNQIIFGANHFISLIPFNSSCWIVFDKNNGNNKYADCELAWTSFKTAVRKFTYTWNGMLQENMKNKEIRIHPTQKPVALYKWLLSQFTKPGNKIIDTHMGSGSIAIACNDMNVNLTAIEIDEDYFNAACNRIKIAAAQGVFDFETPESLPPPLFTG